MKEWIGRAKALFSKRALDEDLNQELEAHLDLAIQENLDSGLPPEEARRQALVGIGGIQQAKEEHRTTRGLPTLEAILRDLRYAVRTLRRDAGLTTFAILIVGIGVGASSTVFSVCNALFLRPLPFNDPARLIWIANGTSKNLSAQTTQVASLLDLRTQSRSFENVAGYSPFYGIGDILLGGAGEPERLTSVPVTQDFFALLGIQPQLGRFFTSEESQWKAPKTVVLSHQFWQSRLAADPAIVGRTLILDRAPATVIGVLPESFDFAAIFTPGAGADLFQPFPLAPETNRQGNTLAIIGRLKPGANLKTAQAEASLIGEQIRTGVVDGVSRNGFRPVLSALRQRISGQFDNTLLLLVAAVGFLMLLVCANLSNLLLARASARQTEMAIRSALGAGRGQLVRQMLIESVTLACCGAALGLALALTGTTLLARLEGTSIPLLQDVRVDGAALSFTLLVAILTGIIFGLAPALQVSEQGLKAGARGSTGTGWTRRSLVVAEIALVCVLLTGAGLLMRSMVRVLDAEMGFETQNVMALRIDPGKRDANYTQKVNYFDEILNAVRSAPGIEQAALTDALPLGDNYGWRNWNVGAKGQVYERGKRPLSLVRIVDDAYLQTMRISLKAGRGFTSADNASAEPVIIVNEKLARTLWPGEDPLGRLMVADGKERRVIGVTGGVRYFGPEQDPGPEMYLSIRQCSVFSSVDLVLRVTGNPKEIAPRLTAVLKGTDPNLPATNFRTLQQLVDKSTFPRRFVVLLLIGFAGFGLILAALGLYAVISYSVTQRRQEIGIRMALGATPADLQAKILMETGKLALIGLAIGIPSAWIAAKGIQSLLFGVESSDPTTFATVLILLAAVAALAGYLPARRASRLNPLDALRH